MAKNIKKHKFNALDAILLIVILALIGAAVFIFVVPNAFGKGGGDTEEREYFEVEYEVQFKTVPNELCEVIKKKHSVGETVCDAKSARELGELVEFRFADAVYTGTDNTDGGKLVYSVYPDHSDVTVVIRTEARITDVGRYAIDEGYDISVGTGVTVKLPYFTDLGYCTSFRVIDGDAEEAK